MNQHSSYELFEELGRGEHSIVYRGFDLNLNREVAIKQFRGDTSCPMANDPRRVSEFLKEAAFLAQFEHEHILRIYSVEKQQGWIVMELMSGTLTSLIAREPMDADMVRGVLRQILEALAFLHDKNKVHAAVRPSNVLINDRGTVKLSDFEQTDLDGELRAPSGSKKYLAPELIRADFGSFGPAVDFYCLGFTALELLTGKRFDSLFPGTGAGAIDSDVAWLRWHSSEDALTPVGTLVPTCPADLATVIDEMLQKHAADRPSEASEILSRLENKPLLAVPVPQPIDEPLAAADIASMLPSGDVQLREWSPLPPTQSATKPRATQRVRSLTSTGTTNASDAKSASRQNRLNQILAKPYVLWPLCTTIILLALWIGWSLIQSPSPTPIVAKTPPHAQVTEGTYATKSEEGVEKGNGSTEDTNTVTMKAEETLPPLTPNVNSDQTNGANGDNVSDGNQQYNEGANENKNEGTPTKGVPPILESSNDPPHDETDRNKTTQPSIDIGEDPAQTEEIESMWLDDRGKLTDQLDGSDGKLALDNPDTQESPIDLPRGILAHVDTRAIAEQIAKQFTGPAELVIDSGGYINEITDIDFSPDGQTLAVAGDKVVRMWDTRTGELINTLRGDRTRTSYGNVYAVAFSPNGKHLLVGVGDYAEHGSIRVYETSDWTRIKRLLPGHTAPCRKITFSRDGSQMISVDADGSMLIWDWANQTISHRIPARDPDRSIYDALLFPSHEPFALAIDFEGPQIYSTSTAERLSAADPMPSPVRGWLVDVFNRLVTFPYGSKSEPRVVDLRLEESIWAAAGVGKVDGANKFWVGLWKARPPQTTAVAADQLGQYDGHRWSITSVAIAPGGDVVASGDKFGEVHVWNARTGEQLHRFVGQGRPVYEVAFEKDQRRIAFGTRPHTPQDWKRNAYGSVTRILDLRQRAILDAKLHGPLRLNNENTNHGDWTISVSRKSGEPNYHLQLARGDSASSSQYRISSGRNPTVFTLLGSPRLDVQRPVIFGDSEGLLALWDTASDELRRAFIGHQSMVTGVSPSSDGKLLVSASTDRTIRLWSLQNYRPTGLFDFKFENSAVIEVLPGSTSARAGVRVGDRIASIDGMTLTEMFNLMLTGEFNYQPGDRVPVTMQRDNRKFDYEMELAVGYDFSEPLLNCFIGDDGDWVIWHPQGYYDASPGADRLIGWHVNRGPDKSAIFYEVGQFRKQLYRPDIINHILETGSLESALELVKTTGLSDALMVDLRDPIVLAENMPPTVSFLAPSNLTETESPAIMVACQVENRSGTPLREATLLRNGEIVKVFRPPSANASSMEIEAEVELVPGTNELTVVASNSRATSRGHGVSVQRTASPTDDRRNAWVLAIGVAHDSWVNNGSREPSTPAKDAKNFAQAVAGQANGRLYADVTQRVLRDEAATKSRILEGLQWLVDHAERGDAVMLYISTSGLVDSSDNFYLATHDVDPNRVRATAVAWREFIDTLHHDLPPCRRMVFLDIQPTTDALRPGMRNPLLDLATPELGTILLSSSTLQQPHAADSNDLRRGIFMQAVLNTISNRQFDTTPLSGDSLLNPHELAVGVTRHVKLLSKDQQHPVFFAPDRLSHGNVIELLE